jgi:hypothetical protein
MGRDARNAQRREEEWLANNARQQCVVCRRWFIKRAENVCSIACAEKVKADEKRVS